MQKGFILEAFLMENQKKKMNRAKIPLNSIQRCFDRSAQSYDTVAHIQKQCAERLVRWIVATNQAESPQTILDIGAGTGFVTQVFQAHFPQCYYSLNDLSPKMLQQAQTRLAQPAQQLICEDAQTFPFPQTDWIVSNFALQWMSDWVSSIHHLFERCQLLAFTILLNGTFQEWEQLHQLHHLPSPVPLYPSLSELQSILQDLRPNRLWIQQDVYPIAFASPIAFARYLHLLGAQSSPFSRLSVGQSLTRSLLHQYSGLVQTTFQIAWVQMM